MNDRDLPIGHYVGTRLPDGRRVLAPWDDPVAIAVRKSRSGDPVAIAAVTEWMDAREPLDRRPRLLDLFCGAGGATRGYQLAGFRVTGVDNRPQPRYAGDEFHQAGALDLITDGLFFRQFAAVHASPPCQDHIRGGLQSDHGTGHLLALIRSRLEETGLPWVIENVPGAPMRADYQLCGSQFGLPIRRHRWFETSWHGFSLMPPCDHSRPIVGVYGHPHGRGGAWPGMLPGTPESWADALGVDWMTPAEMSQAIPPAYTEYIGTRLLDHLARDRAA